MTSFLLVLWGVFSIIPFAHANENMTQHRLYWSNGCPHCALVEEYLEKNDLYHKFCIESLEVSQSKEHIDMFVNDLTERGEDATRLGVPAMVVGDEVIRGDRPIITYFENLQAENPDLPDCNPEPSDDTNEAVQLPTDNLFWFVVGGSLVDAINPCAFAVLIILLTKVLIDKNKKRVLLSGGAFALAIFIAYMLMGLGIYQTFGLFGETLTFMRVIGVLAILIGLLNMKDFFWYGAGFKMEVPMSWRPTMKMLLEAVTNPLTAFGIGLVVSLFLLPCTSGPYVVVLAMLQNAETFGIAFMYLILYNLIFVLPMIGITIGVYYGLSLAKTEEKRKQNLRVLHLVAGLVMVAMGVWILLSFWG